MSLKCFMHKVHPHYPVRSDWQPFTPWEIVDGRYKRLFRSRSQRTRHRKAVIQRASGGWRWRVFEINREGKVTLIGESARDVIYTLAYNAFNPAEVSATTK